MGMFMGFTDLFCLCKKCGLKSLSHIPDLLYHSAFFQNKIPPIFTFFQKYLLRNFWYEVRHSMIIKCFNCAESIKKSYFPHNCEHIDWYPIPISRNFIWSFWDFQSNYSLPEASIHELYSTLIFFWGG